jgi:protein tyrosine/serine phosphatase
MRKFWRATLGALVFIPAACALYVGILQLRSNFHVVIPGELYRSAQPSANDIRDYARQYGIRTVVNLRGAADRPWYKAETDAAREAGIVHLDFKMYASKQLSPERVRMLANMLRDAPKPILIHCFSGSDRTGLASVVYLHEVAGRDEAAAERQLSFFYGHVAIPKLSSAYAMDLSWEEFEKTLGLKS